jgi:hypothetical protein
MSDIMSPGEMARIEAIHAALPPGTRVTLTSDVERYPHFIAPRGTLGTVVDLDDGAVFSVLLDEPLAGAEAWGNHVHWYLDHGDDPTGDVAPAFGGAA